MAAHTEPHTDIEPHHHSLKPYVLVLLALFGLTVVTVLAAELPIDEPWSDLVALAIAMVKATLVVYFFMHVQGSTTAIRISALAGFFWLLIFFAIIFTDFLTRDFIFDLL